MGKNCKGSLYFQICRYLTDFKYGCITDENSSSLICLVKKCLKNLDEEVWSETKDNYGTSMIECLKEQDFLTYTVSEKLIMFVMFSIRFGRIDECFLDLASFIASSFAMENVNPYNYENYLNMFLDEDVCKEIQRVDFEDRFNVLTSLIRLTPLEDLQRQRYTEALKFLCKYNGVKFSPVFKGDYSIPNVYVTLASIIEKDDSLWFGSKDRERLEMILDICELATDNFKDHFAKTVEQIEDKFDGNKAKIATVLIRSIPIYLAQLTNGFEVISSDFSI